MVPSDADHLECNKQLPMGCDRCRVSAPPICCNIDNPTKFTEFTSNLSKPPATPPRSRIPKYGRTQHDHTLLDALDGWREQTTATIYGWHHLNDMGPSIMMCNATIECIIDCAHHCMITSVPELKRETGWFDADQFGGEIIALIQSHTAPLPTSFVSTPLRLTASGTVNTALPSLFNTAPASPCPLPNTSAPKRKNRCGACGEEGHNGTFYFTSFLMTA
ncbi:hypothetical protein PAXRUDRAFT_16125 [Paxillus rubicundulus Ve08.2h10]|uniref:Unplaced genomic scaffold scaffold_1356, whole genome shotgun sequence n=1 Tax=Paxillus rubicundulus Ve08.2h10 TaxID=930991 RepID=A0A0D0CA87_9AGAM|nr:hypothetical protein PAXRUDRAFT_16125 [Paxillus rubicundulus Ve08.2h10]